MCVLRQTAWTGSGVSSIRSGRLGSQLPPGGCVKERDLWTVWDTKIDGLMKGERGAIKRLRTSPELLDQVEGTCYCSWR